MTRPFRFGVNLLSVASRDEWAAKCQQAEQLGYDVVLVPDHLGAPAPFPALVAAAEATERPRLGTFVLNAGLWNPALLAREVATTDQLTGGRLELGRDRVRQGGARPRRAAVRQHRERQGFSYFCVLEPHLEALAPVIEELRGD
jgi:hypothetical protein